MYYYTCDYGGGSQLNHDIDQTRLAACSGAQLVCKLFAVVL